MNRSIYRLIFNTTSGMHVPAAEIARGCGKRGPTCGRGLLFAVLLLAASAQAELPVPCAAGTCGAGIPDFVSAGQAGYHAQDHHAVISQVGDKAILNWET